MTITLYWIHYRKYWLRIFFTYVLAARHDNMLHHTCWHLIIFIDINTIKVISLKWTVIDKCNDLYGPFSKMPIFRLIQHDSSVLFIHTLFWEHNIKQQKSYNLHKRKYFFLKLLTFFVCNLKIIRPSCYFHVRSSKS